MVSIDDICVEFGATPLFNDITFVINNKDRIALVGKNGAGKSTLLKIIAGQQSPTKGTVSLPKNVSIGYLPQVMVLSDSCTVIKEAEKAFEHFVNVKKQLEQYKLELESRNDYDSESYHKLIEKYTQEQEHFLLMGGGNYHAEIEKTLIGLGFKPEDFNRPTSEFSGGWRMRIELAKLLLGKPDLLLLDEPTNHLDIESIQWLENFLITNSNTVVLVSHDRAFINNVTTRTIEISCGNIYDYKVKYDQFVQLRKERIEQQLRAYENQQKSIAETEEFIERFRYKATKAVQVQSRIKQLNKLERIEIDNEDTSTLKLKFPAAPHSGSYPIITKALSKSYGDHVVFSNVNIVIERGQKVAFVGKNGEGKSTLIKCIMNEIPFDGELKIGHNIIIGYFAQNQAQLLDESLTIFETIDNIATGDIRTKIRDILGAFMFGGEAIEKKVKVLSGGERSRLAMIKLLLQPVNLLILDEPTNHLDMRSKDVLKSAIQDFTGTVILVSHDRDFLDGIVDKIYEFSDGKVIEHLGGIYDFLEKKKITSLNELNKKAEPVKHEHKDTIKSKAKIDYEEQKALNKRIKRIEKSISDTEKEIQELEKQLNDLEKQLSTIDDSTNNNELYIRHGRIKNSIDEAMDKWESYNDELENLIK